MSNRLSYNKGAISAHGFGKTPELITKYFNDAFPKPNAYSPPLGGTIDINVVNPMTYEPYGGGKIGWLMEAGNGSYPATGVLRNVPTDWNQVTKYICHEHYGGGRQEPINASDITINANYIQDEDCAVLLTFETVRECATRKGLTNVAIPYPIVGWDFNQVSYPVGQGSIDANSPGAFTGLCVKGTSTGTLGTAQTGTITCTMNTTTEFDDWIVIKTCALYGRAQGATIGRVSRNPTIFGQHPALIGKVNSVQNIQQYKQKVWLSALKYTEIMIYQGVSVGTTMYSYIPMPSIGIQWTSAGADLPVQNEPSRYFGVFGKQYTGIPYEEGFNNRSCNAPWVSGYYNQVEWHAAISNDVGYTWQYTPDIAEYTGGAANGWMTVAGDPSPDYLREMYGAQNLILTRNNTATINRSNMGQYMFVGAVQGGDRGAGVFNSYNMFGSGNQACQRLAFPDKESAIAFFKDWGILATENPEEAINAPNEDAPELPGETWGDWDPDAPPREPWENPTNPGGGKPPVDYDPTDPGTTPLKPQIPLINPAATSNGFVMDVGTLYAVQDWLCNGDFLKDSSNLFIDKMSAFNGATMFPFDVQAHDPQHCTGTPSIVMAGAATQLSGLYKIEGAYNCWVHGGDIEFGKDWKALRPDFNAFTNSSYFVFIPFVGNIEVPPSSVIYRKLSLDYAVDIINGAATAVLRSYPAEGYESQIDAGFIVGLYPCQIGQPVPFVSDNTTQRNFAITMGAISGAMGGGSEGFKQGKRAYNAMGGAGQAAGYDSAGFMTTKATAGAGAAGIAAGAGITVVGAAIGAAKGALESALSNPYELKHAGSIGSLAAWATGFTAYLTVTSQIPATPVGYQYVMGQQTSQRGYLYKFRYNNLNYVECYAVKIAIPGATATEMKLISEMLQGGVFI